MLKITAFLSLMLIGVYAARLSCGSCGQECERACGTRRFRTCCFNYLRKKRGPDAVQFWSSNEDTDSKSRIPAFYIEYLPEDAISNVLASVKNNPEMLANNQAA